MGLRSKSRSQVKKWFLSQKLGQVKKWVTSQNVSQVKSRSKVKKWVSGQKVGLSNQWAPGESVTLNNYRVFHKVCYDDVVSNVQSEACDSVTHIIQDGQESQWRYRLSNDCDVRDSYRATACFSFYLQTSLALANFICCLRQYHIIPLFLLFNLLSIEATAYVGLRLRQNTCPSL